jgi:hypothetical protein
MRSSSFQQVGLGEPVRKAVFIVCFVVGVAPLAWGHVGTCAGIFEEVEMDALLGDGHIEIGGKTRLGTGENKREEYSRSQIDVGKSN